MARNSWAVRAAVVLTLVAGPAAGASGKAPGQDDARWRRVQQLEKGEEVIIGVSGRQPLKYTLLAADLTGLVVVKPTMHELDDEVLDAFVEIGTEWPAVLSGMPAAAGGFGIRAGAVYRKDEKLMDLDSVVERIDRESITEVRGAHTSSAGDPSRRAAKSQGLLGAGVGAAIGLGAYAVTAIALSCDVSDCMQPGVQGAAVAAGIGALIVGLRGALNGYKHDTFYVAPKAPARTLDDVPWERLRLALPPSLQGAADRAAARR